MLSVTYSFDFIEPAHARHSLNEFNSVLAYSQFSVFTFPFSVPLIHLALRAETCLLQGSADGLNVLVIAGFYLKLQDAIGHTI